MTTKTFIKYNKYIFIGIIVFFCFMIIIYFFRKPYRENYTNQLDLADSNSIPRVIWLYWHDNIEESPGIIKYCINTVKQFNKDYKINILNEKNKHKFVKCERTLKHLNDPKLSHTHKSDLLRLYLIDTYGGIYLDSSIILLKPLDWIYNLDNNKSPNLIMYKAKHHTTNSAKPILENWFIAAKPNQPLIHETKNMLLDIFDTNNIEKELNKIKSDGSIDYQNFISMGTYHLTYYCLVYVQHKFDLSQANMEFIECDNLTFPFNILYGNQYVLSQLYTNPISDDVFNKYMNNNLIKLASYNRKFIEIMKLKPVKNSFFDKFEGVLSPP